MPLPDRQDNSRNKSSWISLKEKKTDSITSKNSFILIVPTLARFRFVEKLEQYCYKYRLLLVKNCLLAALLPSLLSKVSRSNNFLLLCFMAIFENFRDEFKTKSCTNEIAALTSAKRIGRFLFQLYLCFLRCQLLISVFKVL